jgi:hypothetical protein
VLIYAPELLNIYKHEVGDEMKFCKVDFGKKWQGRLIP